MELSARKEKILAAVCGAYVLTGDPVGSKLIAAELGVSSATVRNDMADLAEMGFLAQPHTSAGRIPSAMGYRFYIDRLMRVPLLTRQEQSYVDSVLQPNAFDPEKLLGSATEVIAELTRMAAVATTPSGSSAVIRGVQFVQVGRRTAMILLMSSAGTIKSRIFHCDFDLSQDVLRVFFRLLNGKLAGRPVSSITPAFVQSLLASFGEMAVLMSSALRALLDVVNDTIWTRVCLSGQMNLLYYPEYDRSSARRVMDLLERPRDVVSLLQQDPGTVQVRVGPETRCPELVDSSLVTVRYRVGNEDAGGMAVIGPMRMDYGKTTAVLSYVSDSVSQMLTTLLREQ